MDTLSPHIFSEYGDRFDPLRDQPGRGTMQLVDSNGKPVRQQWCAFCGAHRDAPIHLYWYFIAALTGL